MKGKHVCSDPLFYIPDIPPNQIIFKNVESPETYKNQTVNQKLSNIHGHNILVYQKEYHQRTGDKIPRCFKKGKVCVGFLFVDILEIRVLLVNKHATCVLMVERNGQDFNGLFYSRSCLLSYLVPFKNLTLSLLSETKCISHWELLGPSFQNFLAFSKATR